MEHDFTQQMEHVNEKMKLQELLNQQATDENLLAMIKELEGDVPAEVFDVDGFKTVVYSVNGVETAQLGLMVQRRYGELLTLREQLLLIQ